MSIAFRLIQNRTVPVRKLFPAQGKRQGIFPAENNPYPETRMDIGEFQSTREFSGKE
jgi:hypothetical protein